MWNHRESQRASEQTDQLPVVPATLEGQPHGAKASRMANIGRTVFVKGELTGSEDLMIDGRVEGRIDLPDHALTIGPNGHIQADIVVKVVTVFGSIVGGITALDKVEIRRGGSLEGDLVCTRIAIQEGAHLCGKVEMGARPQKPSESETEHATVLSS